MCVGEHSVGPKTFVLAPQESVWTIEQWKADDALEPSGCLAIEVKWGSLLKQI